jgi:predicted phosphoribosyltransferase
MIVPAVRIADGADMLDGDLHVPENPAGIVIFAHGSGGSRSAAIATWRNPFIVGGSRPLLMDLLTRERAELTSIHRDARFDISRLGRRVVCGPRLGNGSLSSEAANRLVRRKHGRCRGAIAAAGRPDIAAVVSARRASGSGGRHARRRAGTHPLIVGDDEQVISLNEEAIRRMRAPPDRHRAACIPLFGPALEGRSGRRSWFYPLPDGDAAFNDHRQPFINRRDAGRTLATYLSSMRDATTSSCWGCRAVESRSHEVAQALGAPLDLFLVRKLRHAGHRRACDGGQSPPGNSSSTEDVVRWCSIPESVIEAVVREEQKELERRERAYREDRPAPDLRNRIVIVIDDGLATGSTMRAAAQAVRGRQPSRVVVAVPVGARETCAELAAYADEVICARMPEPFASVGQWYLDFNQTDDEEVRALLQKSLTTPQPHH